MITLEDMARTCSDLQRKVKKIAVAWFTIHVIGFVGEILFKIQKYGSSDGGLQWYEHKIILYMAIETMIGLVSSVCLFFGAHKSIRYLLLPFMLVSVVAILFLLCTIVMICVSIWFYGLPTSFFAVVLLFILLTVQTWMLKTTLKYYNELFKKEEREQRNVDQTCNPGASQPRVTVPSQHQEGGYAAMNQAGGQTSLGIPSATNENENLGATTIQPELPPAYSDTVIVSMDDRGKGELPPSYDDAMAMKEKGVGGNLV